MEKEAQAQVQDQHKKTMTTTKKRGGIHLLRLAIFMIKGRSTHKSTTKGSLWKNLVNAICPLRQLPGAPPPSLGLPMTGSSAPPPPDKFHDVLSPPPSLPSSRYASADDLKELDRSDGEMDGGDEAIDCKAEEFITKFYEQMKLQRLDSVNCYDNVIESGVR